MTTKKVFNTFSIFILYWFYKLFFQLFHFTQLKYVRGRASVINIMALFITQICTKGTKLFSG
jgi:hypothetical protein